MVSGRILGFGLLLAVVAGCGLPDGVTDGGALTFSTSRAARGAVRAPARPARPATLPAKKPGTPTTLPATRPGVPGGGPHWRHDTDIHVHHYPGGLYANPYLPTRYVPPVIAPVVVQPEVVVVPVEVSPSPSPTP